MDCLQPNTDISGLGIRISFYIQTVLLVFLTERSVEEGKGAMWTLIATTIGLCSSALIQDFWGQLSLYQAILCTYLIMLSTFATFFTAGLMARAWESTLIIRLATVPQTIFSFSFVIYVWIHAPHFTSDLATLPESTIFVYFIPVHVLGPGRPLSLATVIVGLAIYLICLVYELYQIKDRRRTSPVAGAERCHTVPDTPENKWSSLDPNLVALAIIFLPIFIYIVCATEITIRHNNVCPGDKVWQFGQVLALFVTAPAVISTFNAFRMFGTAKRVYTHIFFHRTKSDDPEEFEMA